MKAVRLAFVLLVAICVLQLTRGSAPAAGTVVTPAMVGTWQGDARIVVAWCRQPTLPIAVEIAADGTVTGKVGDATLAHGRLAANRGALGRKLNLATDYIITGELTGPIVAAENITRKSVSIPLDFTGTTFTGGLHTSGSKFGGKAKMILSAGFLTLTHPK
jgi:hypothetical protein